MQRLWLLALLLLNIFCSSAWAFDRTDARWTLDLSYHYARTERATTSSNINFLSRSGGMLGVEFTDNFSLFWRYYLNGDIAFGLLEAPGSNTITPRDFIPWQANGGIAAQFGDLKNLELFFGAGYSTEFYNRLVAVERYTLNKTHSIRAHLGFRYRFLSIVGTTAQIMARYSLPVTPVEHFSEPFQFNGILDGSIRLRYNYDSPWSFYGGIRFEDYETEGKSVTYFVTRIHMGLGIHF